MGQTATTAASAADPRSAERGVLEIVDALVGELGTTPVRGGAVLDDSLDRDLGIGSLERVELLVRLEQAFAVSFPDRVMADADSPRDLVAAIRVATLATPAAAPIPEAALPPAGAAAPPAASTLIQALAWHADTHPARPHIVLLDDDGKESTITYGRLRAEAADAAAGLLHLGVERGASVALMLRTEPAFFTTFFGILLAGAVPVPIYPPTRARRLEEYAERQVKILANAEARLLVTFPEVTRLAGLLRDRVPSLDAVATPERLASGATAPRWVAGPEDPALIQYTSGSTGDPKGVLLTHANLLANIRALGQALDVRPDDVCVSWLPLYHDMGLIGAWLGSLFHGVPAVIFPPTAFLARPARWLQAIAARRGTISAAPNFAFDLCTRKISDAELRGVDLGAWRLAMNGSEAVSAETIERFTRRFAAYGFRREAMCPVYGLAESSVGLTTSPPGHGARIDRVGRGTFERQHRAEPASEAEPSALVFVSCGVPLPGHEVRIVDSSGSPLPERVEGLIEFRGPSVSRGYFRNPDATVAVLHEGWMDSGDLGYQADGELYVTGRRKDVIIKAGRNLHPQEVEELVGDTPGVRKGCVAAFGVNDPTAGTERLIVVAESRIATTDAARASLAAAVRARVVDALGLPPDLALVVPPGSVLKTSSGKVRRSATREAWLAGRLARPAPAQLAPMRLAVAALAARSRRAAERAGRLAFGAWVGAVLLATLPWLWLLVALLPGRVVDRVVRAWCRAVLALVGCRPCVVGVECVPATGGVVLAGNHASYVDAVALLATIPRDFRFVAKHELRRWPLVGAVIRKVGHLTVERGEPARSVEDARKVTGVLRGGCALFFFPEGTFLRPPVVRPFRLGAFKAAADARCPVIPVAINGTRAILPAGAWLPRRGRIAVTIGAPLVPSADDWREIVRLRDATRAEIIRTVGERAA